MATILTSNQRLITGVMYPRGVYSRIISCCFSLAAGGGNFFSFTPGCGQMLWLLGVTVWITLKPGGADTAVSFNILTGFQAPASYADINTWTNILPNYYQGAVTPYLVDTEQMCLDWSLNRHFTGQGRRFGFSAVGTNSNAGYFIASFEISEG